ncbi:MAG TPA: hypothetical protein VK983_05105 [Candidatus Limnocylindrales bacterium]|nr:hypothetical protein [Candidatus Limnocylindrales bacterium]
MGIKALKWRLLKRKLLRKKRQTSIVVAALALTLLIGFSYAQNYFMNSKIDNANFSHLLDTIAKGESRGNYNAYYGNASNTSILFTNMTVKQVLLWQEEYVKQGSPSSAVGKYQFIRPTLQGLVKEHGIDTEAKFDKQLQDELAIKLLERRGVGDYLDQKLSREEFAANLAKEWAALPRVIGPNPEQSYYAGDGLNKVQVSIADIFQALDTLKT